LLFPPSRIPPRMTRLFRRGLADRSVRKGNATYSLLEYTCSLLTSPFPIVFHFVPCAELARTCTLFDRSMDSLPSPLSDYRFLLYSRLGPRSGVGACSALPLTNDGFAACRVGLQPSSSLRFFEVPPSFVNWEPLATLERWAVTETRGSPVLTARRTWTCCADKSLFSF